MVRGPACGSGLGTIFANHAAFPRLALLRNRSVRARLRSSLTAPVCGFAASRRRRFAPTVPSPLPQLALAKPRCLARARWRLLSCGADTARPTPARSAATALPPRRFARAPKPVSRTMFARRRDASSKPRNGRRAVRGEPKPAPALEETRAERGRRWWAPERDV